MFKYSRFISRLCSLVVILNALAIFADVISPRLTPHPNSDLIYTSKFGVQILIQVVSAYFSLILGVLLYNRSRIIWRITIVLLFIIGIGNLFWWFNSFSFSIAVIAIVFLLIVRKIYDQDVFISYGFIFVIGFLIFALLYGTIGVYQLRADFYGIKSLSDAVYFTIVTYSTVGYGDIYPQTFSAKCYVISMIIIGLILFTSSVTLIAFKVNTDLKKFLYNINKGKFGMLNHVILIGYGVLAKILIQEYQLKKQNFLVIDINRSIDHDRQILIDNNSLLIAPYMGHSDTFVKAQAELASMIVIALDTDEATIFAIMNAKEYFEEKNLTNVPKILAVIFYKENINKAKRAGADEVIAPQILAVQKILGEEL